MLQIQISNFDNAYTFRSHIKVGQYRMWEHLHQNSELVFVREGSIDVNVDGKMERANKNDIIIIPPFSVHSFNTEAYSDIWMVVFSNNFISDIVDSNNLYLRGERSVFTPSKALLGYFVPKIMDTDEISVTPTEKTARRMKAILYAIYEEYTDSTAFVRRRSVSNALSAILSYTHEHCRENIKLSDVAKSLGYNPNYISHCLNDLRGLSFRTLLNSFRVEYAKNMLLQQNGKSIKMLDIALECGFSCERTFYRVFSEITGTSPSKYPNLRQRAAADSYEILRPISPDSLFIP